MEIVDVSLDIKALVKKAAEADESDDATRFAQAACNAANAMACLDNVRRQNLSSE